MLIFMRFLDIYQYISDIGDGIVVTAKPVYAL